jgi:hypothetical protein
VITSLGDIGWASFAFAAATLVIILGFKRCVPRIPGAVVAVALMIIVSAATDASSHGVAVVGSVNGGFPTIGLPDGIDFDNLGTCAAIAFSCCILIIAQSAATSRSFAMKHGQSVDVNRDILGLSGANFAAGLSGTFVVNGSPTKTEILDEQKGRTQLANLTMSAIVLLVALFFTAVLTDMPKAVLGAIVFLIGIGLVDIAGLRRIAAHLGGVQQHQHVPACRQPAQVGQAIEECVPVAAKPVRELECFGDAGQERLFVHAAGQVGLRGARTALTRGRAQQIRVRAADRDLAHGFTARIQLRQQAAFHGTGSIRRNVR